MAATKLEPMEEDEPCSSTDSKIGPVNLEDKIIELCGRFPQGLPDAELATMVGSHISTQQRAAALNALLCSARIEIVKHGAVISYKLREQTAINAQSVDPEERVVYDIIAEAKDKGIWVRDVRKQSNLNDAHMRRLLRSLESRKLIKAITTVDAKRKKLYMLYELKPHYSLTGGTFYSNQEFDVDFASTMCQLCLKFLQLKNEQAKEMYEEQTSPFERYRASLVSVADVLNHLKDSKVSNVELSEPDVGQLLDTLVLDGLASRRSGPTYRATVPPLAPAGMVRIPCGLCPVFGDCSPGREINPATCKYLTDWLNEAQTPAADAVVKKEPGTAAV